MHGFEREGIRIDPNGELSPNAHPLGLGSSLTHEFITTDFCEPQLELVTPPSEDLHEALHWISQIQRYTTDAINGERIWPFSMPPRLPIRDDQIPLAVYGNSELGQAKTLYRRGIGLRYGRRRLTISGSHYNVSLDDSSRVHELLESQEFVSDSSASQVYFHIIRNLFRRQHYFTYLFGASPAFDESFAPAHAERFRSHKKSTLYAPYATCLRLSDIGYTSEVQDALSISYDSLDAYAADLANATSTTNPEYLAFSNQKDAQLNANFLQVENELYRSFRIQQRKNPNENLTTALLQRGPSHIENRLMDIDPESPGGVCPHAAGFLHLAMIDTLQHESPNFSHSEWQELHSIQDAVAWRGREVDLKIIVNGTSVSFHESGRRYCEEMVPLAEKLDAQYGKDFYKVSLQKQIEKWSAPENTPSGKHLIGLLDHGIEFIESGLEIAQTNAEHFASIERDQKIHDEIEMETRRSLDTVPD